MAKKKIVYGIQAPKRSAPVSKLIENVMLANFYAGTVSSVDLFAFLLLCAEHVTIMDLTQGEKFPKHVKFASMMPFLRTCGVSGFLHFTGKF